MGSPLYLSISISLVNLLLLFFLVSSVRPLCHPDERSALLQFKESFVINKSASTSPDAHAKTESWKFERESGDCCSWDGVECDYGTGHVIGLDLGSSYLYGSMDSSNTLYHLVHLRRLNLADNFFKNSKIPSEIRNLSRLISLDLSYSEFSGQIPSEILELLELQLLDLSGNSLKLRKTGLSSLLEKLTNLQELYLSSVSISSSVPNISAKFSSLKALILSNCDLRGEFPTGIFELPALQFLNLRSNPDLTGCLPDIQSNHPLLELSLANTSFFGQLPESFGNFKSLEFLDISNCHFSGKLPCSLGNLTKLKYLDLSFNSFWRPVPPSVGNLKQLRVLDFSYNKFSGEIPSSLANLTQLVYLSLTTNHLDPGTFSWLGTQTNLIYLDLSNTSLSGNIPPWIGNLTKLTEIQFQENILSGPIPESIFKLENLELLYLHANQLNGILKLDSFLELKNLTRLQLSGNNLSLLNTVSINATSPKFKLLGLASCNLSEFPHFLRSQDELEFLELSDNRLHGQIPKWFWSVGKETLQQLNLVFNFLTGFEELPVVLPWTHLQVFNLESNMIQGSLPHPPPSIISYSFSNNSLSGEISPMLCNLSFLVALDLSNNNLTGMLPRCLFSLSDSLKVVSLGNNQFTGAIPSTYMKSCGLRMMDLSQNKLQGRIPRSLAHCTKLEVLILGNNWINDTFPSWLGTLPKLKVLSLRANGLHGVIGKPRAKSEFSKLQVIDLSDNSFRGKLPSEYFNIWVAMEVANTNSLSPYMNANTSFADGELSWSDYYNYVLILANKGRELNYENVPDSISAIDLSSNQFQGEIPEAISNLKQIHMLNLSNNNLTGHIPSALGEISNLESLDLSRNKLSGKIPQQLANLNFLASFNVSYNNLEGNIPRGAQFNTFNNDSYEGNSRLCGYPLSEKCGNHEVLQPPPPLARKEDDEGIESVFKFDWKIVMTGYGAGLVIGMSLGYNFTARKHEWFMVVFRKWQVSNNWNGSNWQESLRSVWKKVSWTY
ncbi:LRR receptor-like serine/threonine-protein kinase GSO2 [Herrania umbratica]|uniref:LRR receptor-like serine/threonine-protein kinase GSO2 n=1 Tax=Herrania umbratica TaxID=108875 RepID=A0A6J1BA12_9ROSI|nr:LRR receptor-like serine/threonine-protein kinase GSO2 [Herrania umbratica]